MPWVTLYHDPLNEGHGPHGWEDKWCHNRRACITLARLNGFDLMKETVDWAWGPKDCICFGCGKYIHIKRRGRKHGD